MKELLKMSFYDGTLNRKKALEVIETTHKELKHRYGFSYRGAKALLISRKQALQIVKEDSFLDIDEYENEIILNTYSTNDMY